MPRRSASKKKKKRVKRKRPYRRDKKAIARSRALRAPHHRKKMHQEVESLNYLLHQLLKTASSTEAKPYHYHPRHHTKDPEYAFSSARQQRFKRGFPAPDVSFLRSQGEGLPPHSANYPQWDHPHVGIV